MYKWVPDRTGVACLIYGPCRCRVDNMCLHPAVVAIPLDHLMMSHTPSSTAPCWQVMTDNNASLASYHVPPGCQTLIAIDGAKLARGTPDPCSAYWN